MVRFRKLAVGWVRFMKLFGLVAGVALFFAGLHNMDLGHNMRYLECMQNISLVDYASDGNVYSGKEGILIGMKQMFFGFALLVWLAMVAVDQKH